MISSTKSESGRVTTGLVGRYILRLKVLLVVSHAPSRAF